MAGIGYIGAGIRNVTHILEDTIVNEEPADFETTWVDTGGLTHTVKTKLRDGETTADAAARHQAKVDALLALFPKAT